MLITNTKKKAHMASNAVPSELISRVVGWETEKAFFQTVGPNLPMRIAILGEANTANQSNLTDDPITVLRITSAQQAGQVYGFGSPIHMMARILFPPTGGGLIGGIPVYAYPQAEPVGAANKQIKVAVTGPATANATHTLKIAGRRGLDGQFYNFSILKDDTAADIAARIEDAVNAILGSPMSASAPDESQPDSDEVTLTSKWKGLTANDLVVEVDTNGVSAGITYTITNLQSASGTPDISGATAVFGNVWNTAVINSYGLQSDIITALETFNGIPKDGITPATGRYASTMMKPFVAFTGSTSDDPSATTDASARKTQVTIAVCPAPNSDGLQFEAATNYCALWARISQDSPHLDIAGQYLPDMPVPVSIGAMSDYFNRDTIVKKGCSTVDLVNDRYQVQDFVTTYHPEGEIPPQYRWVRSLVQDWNVRYTYYLLEQRYVADHVLANDNDTVTASKVVKPKTWKGVLFNMYDDLARRAIIAEPSFSEEGTIVNISSVNPDRFETEFPYRRTGFGRILSTTAKAGFNFG